MDGEETARLMPIIEEACLTLGRKRSSYGVETEVKKWSAGCREQSEHVRGSIWVTRSNHTAWLLSQREKDSNILSLPENVHRL